MVTSRRRNCSYLAPARSRSGLSCLRSTSNCSGFNECVMSLPFALEDEPRPIKRMRPALGLHQLDLSRLQRRRWRQPLFEQRAVEPCHQLARGLIVNLPEAGEHATASRVHEPTHQANEALADNLFAERGAARAEDHEVDGEL